MQQAIVDAFLKGEVSGINLHDPKHIQTVISNVFVGEDKVYKIYKNDSEFFNTSFYDLSNKGNRFEFTTADFNWNNTLSPKVYLELKGVIADGDGVHLVSDLQDVDELVIIMKTLDMDHGVFMHLMKYKDLTNDDFYQIGFQFAEKEKLFKSTGEIQLNLYDDFVQRYKDIETWLPGAKEHLSESETKTYLSELREFIESHKAELQSADEYIGVGLDFHSENAVYENGKLFPIDTYPPKKDWRAGHRHINIYRIGADVYALSGEEGYRAVVSGYEDANDEKLAPEYERFFLIYASSIMMPYLYMLGEKDPLRLEAAKKYQAFLRKYCGIS